MPHSIKITGIAPPELGTLAEPLRRQFWQLVTPIALKVKDAELAEGLDAFGEPLKPITARTRKYRRSTMTPSGKGDPNAPPLMPAYQKSRVRSLLAGRAFATHCELYWRYDPFTGASFDVILNYQRAMGRDVFGLSAEALAKVKSQSWAAWAKWRKAGLAPAEKKSAFPSAALEAGPQSRIAGIIARSAEPGAGLRGLTEMPKAPVNTKTMSRGILAPTKKQLSAPGAKSGAMTGEEWRQFFTAEVPRARPPRPRVPRPRVPRGPSAAELAAEAARRAAELAARKEAARLAREAQERAQRAAATRQTAEAARVRRRTESGFLTTPAERTTRARVLRESRARGNQGIAPLFDIQVYSTRGTESRLHGTPQAQAHRATLQAAARRRVETARRVERERLEAERVAREAAEAARQAAEAAARLAAGLSAPGVAKPRKTKPFTARSFGLADLDVYATKGALETARKFFGADVTLQQLGNLTGAPAGSKVTIQTSGSGITLDVRGNPIEIMQRTIKVKNGKVFIHNDIFKIQSGKKEGGLGRDIFARQVENAHKLGVAWIETDAARSGTFNGYYTWPRFGYNAKISTSIRNKLNDPTKWAYRNVKGRTGILPPELRNPKSIADLMETEEGRDWWQDHGEWTSGMEFDLKKSSRSLKTLDAYLKETAK